MFWLRSSEKFRVDLILFLLVLVTKEHPYPVKWGSCDEMVVEG
jgi:hypothetical protein